MIKYDSNNIKALRDANNWSQDYVAKRMNMTKNGYAKIERGESSINMERLKQLADIFEIDIVKLIESNNKGIVCLIGADNIGDNSANNYYGDSVSEIEKLNLIISHKDELLSKEKQQNAQLEKILVQKDEQINLLNLMLRTLNEKANTE